MASIWREGHAWRASLDGADLGTFTSRDKARRARDKARRVRDGALRKVGADRVRRARYAGIRAAVCALTGRLD